MTGDIGNLATCAWEKWLKRFSNSHRILHFHVAMSSDKGYWLLTELLTASGVALEFLCIVRILTSSAWERSLTWFCDSHRIRHFHMAMIIFDLTHSIHQLWLYPISLPHGNDEFYDKHRISSATFVMHSLLMSLRIIKQLQKLLTLVSIQVWAILVV